MKKIGLFIIFIAAFLVPFRVLADNSGKMSLEPQVITNSNLSTGKMSDFPEVANLFLETSSSKNTSNILDTTPARVNYGVTPTIKTTNYAPQVKQLFSNYQPQMVASSVSVHQTSSYQGLWAALLGIVALFLLWFVIWIGRKTGQRRLKKNKNASNI